MDKSKVDKLNEIKPKVNKTSKDKPKTERCHFCNKKLKMINFTCKCNHKFCINHHNPHSHNCSFNNKKICQEKLKLNNPQTIHQKVVKI